MGAVPEANRGGVRDGVFLTNGRSVPDAPTKCLHDGPGWEENSPAKTSTPTLRWISATSIAIIMVAPRSPLRAFRRAANA
jgi:hypothetical protein